MALGATDTARSNGGPIEAAGDQGTSRDGVKRVAVMAKPVQDADFPADGLPPIAVVLPMKNGYFSVVGCDGSIWRLHRARVTRVVADGAGRILEIQLASGVLAGG